MSRVMLVCPEGLARPAGVGIRFLEMARVLEADGHAVEVLSADGAPAGPSRAYATTPRTLAEVSGRSDVAVVQGHVANDFFAHAAAIPVVIDLYDPFIVENFHYFGERGPEVFNHDHATLVRSLLRGDFFLCASKAQRMFFIGMLLATGRVNPVTYAKDQTLDGLVTIAPFGVQPPRRFERAPGTEQRILFGGIYDWYDPVAAIDAVAELRKEGHSLRLTFMRHPNPGTPQEKLDEAARHCAARGHDFVDFDDWTAYEDRGALFEAHHLSLLTFRDSLETELSMRTRIFDYLWAGLPVVTSSAPGTDEILERYGAGIVVRDGGYAGAVARALEPERYAAMVQGASSFVEDHQWERTLAPLRAFCRSPRVDTTKGMFAAAPAPLAPRSSIVSRIRRRMGGLR